MGPRLDPLCTFLFLCFFFLFFLMFANQYGFSTLIPLWSFAVFCNKFHTVLNGPFQGHGRPRSATRRSVNNAKRTRAPAMAQQALEEGTRQ